MNLQKLKVLICTLGVLFCMGGGLAYADPLVNVDVSRTTYAIGDIIALRVNIAGNTGFHGFYFDLGFDAGLFSFISMSESSIPNSVNASNPDAGRLLYAVSDSTTSATLGHHVVASFTLADPQGMTSANGTLAEIRFLVVGSGTPGSQPRFTFRAAGSGAMGLSEKVLVQTRFIDSPAITITAGNGAYVQINTPRGNEAVYKDLISLSATSTADASYSYIIQNKDASFVSPAISAQAGNVTNYQVPVSFGLNRLVIQLRDKNNAVIATDTKTVFRSDSEVFVKIISPIDHALVNTDMVRFLVASPFDAVTVNEQPTEKLSEKYEGENLFAVRLWLRKGFNTIKAEGIGPQGIKFAHSITVFYQQDDLVFRFVEPVADSVIKTIESDPQLSDGSLRVMGEIGSAIGTNGLSNTVTLSVNYIPTNPALKARSLVRERVLPISETVLSGRNSEAPYMFANDFAIPVADLENGDLEIIAYKNKRGGIAEAEIHRVVHLNKSRLSINLVNPNIFGIDTLDSEQKITAFNNATPPLWDKIRLFQGGSFSLASVKKEINEQTSLSGVPITSLIETKDGTRFALVNSNSVMRLYKRDVRSVSWGEPLLSRDDMYGYTLCDTDMGVLLGVSNLYTSDNTGLYLLEGNSLKNVVINKPIPHVQFIQNRNGEIYLYGNDYSDLYSFNVFSLEKTGEKYKAGVAGETPCENDLFISQCVLSDDAKTIMMLNTEGKLYVYQNLYNQGFTEVSFSPSVLSASTRFSTIVPGEYKQGSYRSYLLLSKTTPFFAQVIMEHKASNRLIMMSDLPGIESPDETLLGATFNNDRFVMLYKKQVLTGFEYNIRKANILFNQLTFDPIPVTPFFSDSLNLQPGAKNTFGLLAANDNSYTFGFGSAFTTPKLYELVNTYPNEGEIAFDYRNPDAEALHGFSFYVDPSWIDSTLINLQFALFDYSSTAPITGTPGFSGTTPQYISLHDFLMLENDLFTVKHEYDADRGKELVKVDFVSPEKNRYLSFAFKLNSDITGTQSFSDLSIYKKTVVKLPKSNGEAMLLPIQGWVTDPSAREIKIQETTVPLEKNGYFSLSYILNTAQNNTTISLSCSNAAGERTSLNFTVGIFESVNELKNVELTSALLPLAISPTIPNELSTNANSLSVSANLFGMEGLVAGFETYAYVYTGGVETLKKISGGVFDIIFDSPINAEYAGYGAGYVSGRIENQNISLSPGKQRLIIYVENPGGKRVEYKIGAGVNAKYPDIIYNLPVGEQNIEIINSDCLPLEPVTVNNVTINKQIDVSINETGIAPYTFKRAYTISGKITSLSRFKDLKVKSTDPGILFSNNTQEIIIPVDELNRFEVTVQISVSENFDQGSYSLLFIPTTPFLEWMKTGVRINAVKDYSNTAVIPDFSPMDAIHWKAEELANSEKPLHVKIARHIPSGTHLTLSVNFETPISGLLEEDGVGSKMYHVNDENGVALNLYGLKNGQNRIRWALTIGNTTISSSISGRLGMNDYLLNIIFSGNNIPTVITFPIDQKTYYDASTVDNNSIPILPDIIVTKQKNTLLNILLNNTLVSTNDTLDSYTVKLVTGPLASFLLQGRNTIDIDYTEKSGKKGELHFTFLYDTKIPTIKLFNYTYKENKLDSFSVLVHEANIQKIELFQRKTINTIAVDSLVGSYQDYQIIDIGDKTFKIIWTDLIIKNDPALQPSPTDSIYAKVTDYVGFDASSAPFTGVMSTPETSTLHIVPINIPADTPPALENESALWGNAPFDKRLKIYSSNMTYPKLDSADPTYTINRSGNVTMGGPLTLPPGNTLRVQSGTGVSLQSGFSVPLGKKLSILKPGPSTTVNPISPMLQFKRDSAADQLGVNFWFRFEGEMNYALDNNYKKIFTLAKGSYDGTDYEIYVAYRDNGHSTYGDESLAIIEWRKTGTDDPIVVTLSDEDSPLLILDRGGRSDGWNLVTVAVDKYLTPIDDIDIPIFKISVNGKEPYQLDYATCYSSVDDFTTAITESIFAAGAVYTFGNTNGGNTISGNTTINHTDLNGHFSIARLFYVNKAITNQDVLGMTDAINVALGGTPLPPPAGFRSAYYDFQKTGTAMPSVGPGYLELRMTGNIHDYHSEFENVDYTEVNTNVIINGSLRASEQKINRLKLDGDRLMFKDSASAVVDKMRVDNGNGPNDGWLLLTPTTDSSIGRYSFANNFGSHTVINDRWFSVYGKVAPMDGETSIDATLVLSINGVEQRYRMVPGDFHYVFPNTTNIPKKVIMFIETKTPLKLNKTMFFTEGNYRLPDEAFLGLSQSGAKTKYAFQKTGTIDFWYKPMIANKEGFIDYNVTLLDSEFVTIEAVQDGASGHSVFRTTLKGVGGPKQLSPCYVPVRAGWQHIQFSWDQSSSIGQMAYLYVDGSIVSKLEDQLPVSPSMGTGIPTGDNISFGSDMHNMQYANGFLDEIRIDNSCKSSVYKSRQPIITKYTDGFDANDKANPTLTFTADSNIGNGTVSLFNLTLTNENGDVVYESPASETIASPGLVISDFSPGPYKLSLRALVNGFRYDEDIRFVKNDRPRFTLKGNTALMVSEVPTNLNFDFEYQNSYLLEDDLHRYSGLELIIEGAIDAVPFTKKYYVVQDFTTFTHNDKWLIYTPDNGDIPTEFTVENNKFSIYIPGVSTTEIVNWTYRSFYFPNVFSTLNVPSGEITSDSRGIIPLAGLDIDILSSTIQSKDYEYKLQIDLLKSGIPLSSNLGEFAVSYTATSDTNNQTRSSETAIPFDESGSTLYFYYDDMLKDLGYGTFTTSIVLLYRGVVVKAYDKTLTRRSIELDVTTEIEQKHLFITELSLLQILNSSTGDSAELYVAYDQSGFNLPSEPPEILDRVLYYDVNILKQDMITGLYSSIPCIFREPLNMSEPFALISGVPVDSANTMLRLQIYEGIRYLNGEFHIGLTSKKDLTVVNRKDPPRVVLTNSVPSRIAYNNVKFSWMGYYQNVFDPEIKYSYNFDDKGWSSLSRDWRSVEYYNLSEGTHRFSVRAYYGDNNVSPDVVSVFYVDINRPVIDAQKIEVTKLYDEAGFLHAINMQGSVGSIFDLSLNAVTVNGNPVQFKKDGSFTVSGLPVVLDGDNTYTVAAYDLVGNCTEKIIHVSNNLTEIIYPMTGSSIRYNPVTLVGRLPSKINTLVDIYVRDPLIQQGEANDFSLWHKARINEDFTFFVEDIAINPGTREREAHTILEMAVVSKTGHIYTRSIDVFANEVSRPIDLTLSVHAVEGEKADTQVTITTKANVPNISSWSIDFTGDGIYDDVVIMDDPATSGSYNWTHTYSTLGIVKPRVRAITREGIYFSVYDTLIIHEKIRESSNKIVANPQALSSLTMEDNSQRLYVLAGQSGNYRVEVYEIGRNESYVSNLLFQIALSGMGIENPVKIVAIDSNTLIIAENKNGTGIIHTLKADEFDAFIPVANARFTLSDTVSDMDSDKVRLLITQTYTNTIASVDLIAGIPQPSTLVLNGARAINGDPLGNHMGISKDDYGILLSDFDHQRIVRLSDNFSTLEYRGTQGNGEGEFIKPAIIKSYQNRIFVYDEARADVQFFDPEFNPITRLSYNSELGSGNYLDADFMKNMVGVSVFTREESNRLFYYAVLLSKSSNKLAVLRMPQWEEMRAKVRNNKIIFLKDNEVYSAKPTGSDLTRLISSDSIPRIHGSVDYPTLSPDGKMIAFTSRAKLYDGSGQSTAGSVYAYDNLYTMNTNGRDLTRIPLAEMQGFEIERPQFNSNGTKLIFSAKPTGGHWQIYLYTFETGSVMRLFTSDENARFPYYSPDDRFIAFTTDYDGDEDIQIYDTENPSMRVSVTNNSARDSFPVWSIVYPGEIANPDLKIESKIAFVSDRLYHKGVYYVYISRPSEADIRIVKKTGEQIGNDADQAAIELTTEKTEGDYPSFTGDGTAVVFEHFDGAQDSLLRYDFSTLKFEPIGLMKGSRRPAGMKNTIAQFAADITDGNTVHLKWSRYTDTDVFYTVRFKVNQTGKPYVEKRVFTQEETFLTGLDMGVEYLFRVSINENGEEAAATQWKKVLIPEVAARPSFEIDKANPYLVHLKAWKPKEDTDWGFSWIIDNQEIAVQSSSTYLYEFATSGSKTIVLKAHNKANTYTNVSLPMTVNIVSDIKPVVEYVLAVDQGYVELSAQKSLGKKIDWSSALWTVSGPGLAPPKTLQGSKGFVDISGFKNKINVNLRVSRFQVTGQPTTDTIETNLVLDLDYEGTKLVVIQESDIENNRLITFSGSNSIGNINWREARWVIFRDGVSIYQTNGLSSFAYEFPETNLEARYSVSLSVPNMSDGKTSTTNNIVTIGAAPMVPEIDYEIVELKNAAQEPQGAKIIFSAANSKGNNIDFSQAKWTVPVAGTFGEQPTQVGPTAVYNLFNTGSVSQVEVSLTLMRRGGTEVITVTKLINIKGNQVAKPALIVNRNLKTAGTGDVLELNVLASTGPNIDWERTDWQFSSTINGLPQNSSQRGPAARIEIPASSENTVVRYTVTLYALGSTLPLIKNEELRLDAKTIKPIIKPVKLDGGNGNVYTFSVTDTNGINIDWERTAWYFYDGNTTVTQLYGAQVTHAFVKKTDAMGYPVVVEMYFKNNAKPFYGYTSVDIDADVFMPVITWDRGAANDGSEILLTAEQSTGSNIDWSQAKWTFGDGTPSQYGPTAGHKYAFSNTDIDYKVSLTLTRRLANNETETATGYATVTNGKDQIKPVIKATLYRDGYLVLSSALSEGRGLLLDRSTWMFAGKGDNENTNISKQTGTQSSEGWQKTDSVGGSIEVPFVKGSANYNHSESDNGSDSTSDSLASTDSFSNENYHVGLSARRWIGDYDIYSARFENQKFVTVSLNVYRVDADGGMTGEMITVNINLTEAAKPNGVIYR